MIPTKTQIQIGTFMSGYLPARERIQSAPLGCSRGAGLKSRPELDHVLTVLFEIPELVGHPVGVDLEYVHVLLTRALAVALGRDLYQPESIVIVGGDVEYFEIEGSARSLHQLAEETDHFVVALVCA